MNTTLTRPNDTTTPATGTGTSPADRCVANEFARIAAMLTDDAFDDPYDDRGEAIETTRPWFGHRLKAAVRGRLPARRPGWRAADERSIDRAWGSVHVATARTRQSVTSY